MSSEFASSETTPLRQPDNNNGTTTTTLQTRVNVNNNIQINGSGENHLNNGISTTIHNLDQQNNILPLDHRKMDTNRRIIWKVTFDFIILLCVGLPILIFYLFGEPYKRGFFCDDESLRHPFHDSTVKNYMLYLIGLVLPLYIILTTEFLCARSDKIESFRFMDWNVPAWIVGAIRQIGVFGFGAASQQLIVDIAKYSIGRLRPHFFDVCQPNIDCTDPLNFNRYIEEFTCQSPSSTPRMLKEMRLSFPSGHSSFSTYTMVYCAIYLHSRMNWRGSKLLKHFLQFLLFTLAWFTSLSRISDYKHHWSDVLSGAIIGVISALIVSQFVSDLFRKRFNNNSYLPKTRQEMTATQIQSQVPAHTDITTTTTNQYHQNSTNGHA